MKNRNSKGANLSAFWLIAVLSVLAAAISGRALAQEPIAVIPYRIDYDGLITVEATVNGHGPYDFVLDTGATLTLAFQNLAAAEGFPPTGGPKRRVLGISGSSELDTFVLGEVSFGAAKLENHIGVILPDWGAPRRTPAGIVGIDFLKRYAVVFDVRKKTITLYPHGAIPKNRIRSWKTVKLRPRSYAAASGALYTTKGLVNRSPTTFIIDLGSVATLINYRAAEAMFSSVVSRDLGEGFTTGSRLKDVFDDRTRARTALLNRIQVGRASWRNAAVWVYNAPIFDEIDVQRLPFGLLGADLIASQDFALDFGENKLYLSKINQPER
ncbi:MAG: aspartyl protease family protein [Parvularculaceae bacterium]|nr:aspartyl protease family protein [Parvularculaceae bacterium]